jgi:hypothetical protein
MLKFFALAALCATALLAGCGAPQPKVANQNSNAASNNATTSIQHGPSTANMGVASSHGAADSNAATAANAGAAAAKPPVETPEMDAKIQKAEAKAKAAGASDADKKAAAAAYFERADFYRDQGVPALYKFALRDYRIGLRYDPTAREPRAKMDEIVKIYQAMGRPVPELGNEQ